MFRDRADAGKRLARGLARYAGRADAAVLAVPRGGLPVASREALKERCDEVVCLKEAGGLRAVSESYRDFAQITDEQAVSILRAARS